MSVVQPIKTEPMKAAAGTQLFLDQADLGWAVGSGRGDLFLIAVEDGKPASQRRFLFEVVPGSVIMPLIEPPADHRIMLLVTQASELVPVTMTALRAVTLHGQDLPVIAAQIDQWIMGVAAAMAPVAGVPPDGTCAIVPPDAIACQADAVITTRAGVAWIDSKDTALIYCDGSAVSQYAGAWSIPVAAGTWVTAASAGEIKAISTLDIFGTPWWPDALREFHKFSFAAIARSMETARNDTKERIAARVQNSERLTERVIGSFHSVAKTSRKTWQRGGAHEDERLIAVFMIVAEAIGLDLAQRETEMISRATSVDEAIRSARLRQRQIALRGRWWHEDMGPLIGFIGEDRKPVALLPTGSGRWTMIDPVSGESLKVNAEIAARIVPTAHMLYPTLPDKPIGFKEFLKFGLNRNKRDLGIAIFAAIAGAILALATPLAMRLAFDRFIPGHNAVQLLELAIGLALAAGISTMFRIAYDQAALRIDGRAAGGHPAAVMDRVLRLPESAIRFGSADLALRFGSADQVRKAISGTVLGLIPAVFLALLNGALLFYYAKWAAACAVGAFILLGFLSAFFAWLQREAQKRGEQLESDVYNIVFQLVQAIGVLRTTGSEIRAFAHWGIDFAELRARSHRSRKIQTTFETMLAAIEVLALAGIFMLLALFPGEGFTTGAFMAFILAYAMFAASAMQIVRTVGQLVALDVTWERAAPLLKATPERSAQRRDPGRLSGKVDVTNVSFRYSQEAPPAVQGVSLQVAAGEFVAIVGASGSGKSTMMRLLLGLDQPNQGTIQYDGQDLRHLDTELVRRQIGVVMQNGKLFPGTLFENIMGSFNGTIDDAWEAAKQAGIEPDIRALPMGMHTVVTEASAAFSGGQVQRMIIARALVGKPRLLIFDEATSSLDNVTQAVVTQSLSRLAVSRVVIAHRLTTVRQADRIYVFHKGQVVQAGTYDELVKAEGPFAEFARKQLL
jgi:NHLM bacteriocin system ABC transporter ATP-binding protein